MKIVYSIQEDDGSPAGELWLQSPYNAPAMENPAVAQQLWPIAIENSHVWLINPLFPRPLFPPALQRLSEIRAPTLVIVGDRDLADIQNIVETLKEGIPGIKKVVIPGAGHLVSMEKPEQFNKIVLDFLSQGTASDEETARKEWLPFDSKDLHLLRNPLKLKGRPEEASRKNSQQWGTAKRPWQSPRRDTT